MTRLVIAAVDDSAACQPVLEHAQALAARWHTGVSVLHVDEGHTPAVRELTGRAGLHLRVVRGDPVDAIVRFAHARNVVAVVVGNGALPRRRALGHVAREVVARCHVPVMVVPPSATVSRFERILVPLEGTAETSAAITRLIDSLQLDDDAEKYMLHVFEDGTMPRFANHEPHESDAWVHEFRRAFVPEGAARSHVVMRTGRAECVLKEVAEELGVDLVVLAWSRDLAPGRARVVRAALGRFPTLLVDVDEAEPVRVTSAA